MNTNSVKKQGVTASDLQYFAALQESAALLRKKAAEIDLEVHEYELLIMSAVASGEAVDNSCFTVAVKESSRRCPAWKEHYVSLAGKEAAEAILQATEPSITRHVVVAPVGLHIVK